MTIIEAIQSLSKNSASCIARRAWDYPHEFKSTRYEPPVKLLPTNSPNGVIVISGEMKHPYERWHPMAEDLIADDWITVW